MATTRTSRQTSRAVVTSLQLCAKRAADCRALDDTALVARIASHDRVAFAEIYRRFSPDLRRLVQRAVRSARETCAVLPRAFGGVWEHAWHYRPAMGTPFHWAAVLSQQYTVAWLQAHGRRADAREEIWRMEFEDTLVAGFAPAAPLAEIKPPLHRDDRRALELVFFDGLTRDEAAQLLGVKRAVVEARIGRALLHLRMHAATAAASGPRERLRLRTGRVHRAGRAIAVGQRSAA
jgi:RNA polymerase sigma-70 factor, ECF subfamily